MKTVLAFFLLLTPLAASTAVQPPACLRFEPETSVITGKLIRETAPGPPNFEDVSQGDRADVGWRLRPDKAVCVRAGAGDNPYESDLDDVTHIQLVLSPEQYEKHRSLVGKKVTATGKLFAAHTAHHHTPVLLSVDTLRRAKR